MKNIKVNDQVGRKQLVRTSSPASSHSAYLADMRNHKLQSTFLVWVALVSSALAQPLPHRPVDYVNPLIGTAPFEDAEYLGNNPPKGEELYYGSVVPYYYNYAGAPWKSQEIIRKIMRVLHKPVPGGLCGMDDNGYLTGWYVFSAMGFYPVEPSKGVYVIGSPAFRKVTVHVQGTDGDNGEFVIEARNASEENIYIQSATLNGKTLNRPYFHHSDLIPGGRLVFEMGPIPNKEWGAGPEAAPPSVTPILTEKRDTTNSSQ